MNDDDRNNYQREKHALMSDSMTSLHEQLERLVQARADDIEYEARLLRANTWPDRIYTTDGSGPIKVQVHPDGSVMISGYADHVDVLRDGDISDRPVSPAWFVFRLDRENAHKFRNKLETPFMARTCRLEGEQPDD